MEQVDQIILVTLRDIGLNVDTSVTTSLAQFTDQMVVESVGKCLNIINGNNSKHPEKLPEGMAMRYRVGIELANACKQLGYKADLGYEAFLYSNEVEIRRLLMFLVEKLPRARQDADDATISQTSSLKSSVAQELRRQLQLPWLPARCAANNIVWDGNKKTGSFHYVGGFKQFNARKLMKTEGSRCLGLQCQSEELLSSLLELSTKLNQEMDVSNLTFTSVQNSSVKRSNMLERIKKAGSEAKNVCDNEQLLAKIDSLSIQSEKQDSNEHSIYKITENVLHGSKEAEESTEDDKPEKIDDEAELIKQHEIEKEGLLQTLNQLNEKHNESKTKIDNATRRLDELQKNKKLKDEEVEKLKDEYLLKRKTLQLVPQEKNAVVAMKENVQTAHIENKNVREMWASKESDLISEVENLEVELRTKELQTSEYIEDVKLMREEIAELVSGMESKEEKSRELEAQVTNLPSSINRNAHTKKILDIVDKIKRQKEHIDTILNETKVVQKEINNLNGKIERSFIETDEIIFRDAKNNDQCRKAYKLLANLQSEFNALVRGLDDIGTINRELRDIEDLLQREKEKKTAEQIKKVSKDLAAVVKDNDKMIAAIKSAKASKR